MQWQIQDFPEEGASTVKAGREPNILADFPQNLHENEKKTQVGREASMATPLDPSMKQCDHFLVFRDEDSR